MNIAIFDKPVANGILKPISIDRVTIDNVGVEYSLGPVFQRQKEKQMITNIVNHNFKEIEDLLPDGKFEKMLNLKNRDNFEPNIHSLATIKRIFEKIS